MKRTQADYARLAKNPQHLVDRVNVILRDGAIFVQSIDGRRSIKITPGDGPAGLAVNVERSIGGAPLTVFGNLAPGYVEMTPVDAESLSICQYRTDPWSKAFKAWYGRRGDDSLYPGEAPKGDR